ncbi:hypothetical protein CMK10_00575 [Candidatus Poribacteria bacterium]|jgi:N-acetylmuramoyl-L-alanine amidase|nr:hypothetical protein [Candidatus Poribacteria bacterium]
MKKIVYFHTLPFFVFCLSCATINTQKAFQQASLKHERMVREPTNTSEFEWHLLIGEFERILDAEPNGEMADDTRWAIASCWMWLAQSEGESTGGSRLRAIDAFNQLISNHLDSKYIPEAYFWLGCCYRDIKDPNQAELKFRTVLDQYPNHQIIQDTQLELKRLATPKAMMLAKKTQFSLPTLQPKNEGLVVNPSLPDLSLTHPATRTLTTEPKVPKPKTEQTIVPIEKDLKLDPVVTPEVPPKDGNNTLKIESVNLVETPPEIIEDPSLVQQLGLNVRKIVIDPGHGSKDPGAVSSFGKEKSVVLSLSKILRDLLINKGYDVRMTRETDRFIPLQNRPEFANNQTADLFLSIHANANKNPKASGIETYYLALASDTSASETASRENIGASYSIQELDLLVSKILHESKSEESRRLAECVQSELIYATSSINRGVKHAPFVVLIGAKVPAILIEIGFLSNEIEAKKLITIEYQQKLATAIASGVEDYVTNVSRITKEN